MAPHGSPFFDGEKPAKVPHEAKDNRETMAKVPDLDPSVAAAFEASPPPIRRNLLALRQLIFETAQATEGVGPLSETLKWGEPAYLTNASRSGSTIRLGWKSKTPDRYAMYFNCRTTLVDDFRALFPDALTYEGNRAILFDRHTPYPAELVARCIAMALTYQRRKTSATR